MKSMRLIGWIGLLVCLLVACTSSEEKKQAESQRFNFEESLRLVEMAGRQLQGQGLNADALQQILSTMDEGLKLAFNVRHDYLDKFGPRLSNSYQHYFIKGVEAYRLGIEAGDGAQQKEGLRLLSQWSAFWTEAGSAISGKMQQQ